MPGDCFADPSWELGCVGCTYWNPVELLCEVPCPEACPWCAEEVLV